MARDATDGLISVEHARDVYAVVLVETDSYGTYAVDKKATERLRA